MHSKYHSEAFVLGGASVGDSNRFLYLFTKDFGLVGASVQAVRKNASKLRYGLQDFSLSEISLVKGRHSWKITNVKPIKNFHSVLFSNKNKVFVCASVFATLRKLIPGEEKNEELFLLIRGALDYLEKTDLSLEDLLSFECMFVLRILYTLGYADGSSFEDIVSQNSWESKDFVTMGKKRREAVVYINRALKESQL